MKSNIFGIQKVHFFITLHSFAPSSIQIVAGSRCNKRAHLRRKSFCYSWHSWRQEFPESLFSGSFLAKLSDSGGSAKLQTLYNLLGAACCCRHIVYLGGDVIYDNVSTGAVSSMHRASVTEQKKLVPVFLLELDLAACDSSPRGEAATMPVSAWRNPPPPGGMEILPIALAYLKLGLSPFPLSFLPSSRRRRWRKEGFLGRHPGVDTVLAHGNTTYTDLTWVGIKQLRVPNPVIATMP